MLVFCNGSIRRTRIETSWHFDPFLRLHRSPECSGKAPGRLSLVRPRQAETVAEEPNGKVHVAPRQGPRSAQKARYSAFFVDSEVGIIHRFIPEMYHVIGRMYFVICDNVFHDIHHGPW